MNLSAPFVRRPIGTILLTIGMALAGVAAYFTLPVAPLPEVDFPTISVNANLPGASPETMASSVATPLERRLGAIAGVNEMTSRSSNGSTRVTLQFDLSRDIDGAAGDVQAAINAARADLPASLKQNPSYRKMNPAAAPVIILALTSKTRTPGQMYQEVSDIVQQAIAKVPGVGDVEVGGGSLPAVRVELLPYALAKYGVSLEDVRAAISAANANRPKGVVENDQRRFQIYTNDSGKKAADFEGLIVAWRDGAAIRLRDVASVFDGVENRYTLGLFNGQPALIILISRQPGANVVKTVDGVTALLPQLREQLPADIDVEVASDNAKTIRASLAEVEVTLFIALALVVVVISAFLRSGRATLVPAVAVTASLLGTVGLMKLFGFSLNNLSLMALTVATGFVVDDAIVVLENISRHVEKGMDRRKAALQGAREVGFTVMSISVSLVAVFIPLLFMGGLVGRLFREFAVTLSAAVMISLLISLTTTPMMCALLLKPQKDKRPGRINRFFESGFNHMLRVYERSLDWALNNRILTMLTLVAAIVLNVYLYMAVPKGFFPQQDSGQLIGGLRADQSSSFQAMQKKLRAFVDVIRADPAVATVVGFTGGSRAGGGFMFVNLKPEGEREESSADVINRLRPQLARITGASLFLNPVQDVRAGGRMSNASYQYTLKSDNMGELKTWAAKLAEEMNAQPALVDVDADTEDTGVETFLTIDRDLATQLGVSAKTVDNILYDGFGQRQVSTIYDSYNQHHVVMEIAPEFAQTPEALKDVYLPSAAPAPETEAAAANATSSAGISALREPTSGSPLTQTARRMIPLSAIAHFEQRAAATRINHQDTAPATTISFNLAENFSLSDGKAAIAQAEANIAMPTSVRGSFQGTAKVFQESLNSQVLLIAAALLTIYIVLGILYESYIHPITVLSTLPSAGLGALIALLMFKLEFSIIALIGIILLIGIVKKNAILIIDFALEAERSRGLSSYEAIREACLMRFRPILMTTLAAGLGALPLAIGFGIGAELRRPLGIAIIGGLVASQLLTLLTTPVVYLYLDKLRGRRRADERHLARHPTETPDPSALPEAS